MLETLKLKRIILALLLTLVVALATVKARKIHSSNNSTDLSSLLEGDLSCVCRKLRLLCKKGHMFCKEYRDQCKCTTPTTTRTTPTVGFDCPQCQAQCHNKDRACLRDWSFCDACSGPCIQQGYDVFPISSAVYFEDHTEMCEWCSGMCFGANPDCYHEYCLTCEPQCQMTTSSTGLSYCQECDHSCNNKDLSCRTMKPLESYCFDCSQRCRDQGYEIFMIYSDPPFGDQVAYCSWCESQCYGRNPSCDHGGCGMCGEQCGGMSTVQTTPDPNFTKCHMECRPSCDGRDLSCRDPENYYCQECVPECQALGYEISTFYSDPPFGDSEAMCQWCQSECYGARPYCDHSGCDSCDPNCGSTTLTDTTFDQELQECHDQCYPQCHSRDMSCQSDINNYCYDCVPRCQNRGLDIYYLYSDPPFGDPAGMCQWCESQCYGRNPNCNHGGCWMCDPNCGSTTWTDTTWTDSTTNPVWEECINSCKPQCQDRDIMCQGDQTNYCLECVPRCQEIGVEVYYVVSDPPFWDSSTMCDWCESQCYGRNPDCDHSGCGMCDPNCRSYDTTWIETTLTDTTVDPEWQDCFERCVPQCNNRDMACQNEVNTYCAECVPGCQAKGFEVYYIISDPPFDDFGFCQWCETQCYGRNPNCDHVGCSSCRPDCMSDFSTSSAIITMDGPTLNPDLQECHEQCYPQCNSRDMSCQNEINTYCYECVPRCQNMGVSIYYLFSDPPFHDPAAMCDWCASQCYGANPDCDHGGCASCDPNCGSTTSVITTPDARYYQCEQCASKCEGRDMSCGGTERQECFDCQDVCRSVGRELSVYYSDPPFDAEGFCSFCESYCFVSNPSCEHDGCQSCDPNCREVFSTSSASTEDYCTQCESQCNNVNMNCETTPEICQSCASGCGVRVVYLHPPSDDPCPWCDQNCYGRDPSCNNRACSWCEAECTRTSAGSDSTPSGGSSWYETTT